MKNNDGKLQQELNHLVERRLDQKRKLDSLETEKAGLQEDIKSVKKEFVAIDKLFQEKLDKLNKERAK